MIHQLGQRIENQLRSHESRLSALSRPEAASLRTTGVKLARDYRMVEQQFRQVQLDVKRKRSLAEVRQREAEEEEREGRRTQGGAEDTMTEEGMRWQMQIQEDVSGRKLNWLEGTCPPPVALSSGPLDKSFVRKNPLKACQLTE